MDIKGIIKTGSYKNCVVSICNESYLKEGKLHFVHEDEICKFNIKIVNKPHDCKGKKKIGELLKKKPAGSTSKSSLADMMKKNDFLII
jgi:hypothetical protein